MNKEVYAEKDILTFFVQKRIYEELQANPEVKPKQLDYYLYVITKINRVMLSYKEAKYAYLSSTALQSVLNHRNYTRVMWKLLFGVKMIERSPGYCTGNSFGYRITEKYRDDVCIFVRGTRKLRFTLAERGGDRNDEPLRHQYINLQKLSVDLDLVNDQVAKWFANLGARSNFAPATTTTTTCPSHSHNTTSLDNASPAASTLDPTGNLSITADSNDMLVYNKPDSTSNGGSTHVTDSSNSSYNSNKREEGGGGDPTYPYVTTNYCYNNKNNKEEREDLYINIDQYYSDQLWIKDITDKAYTFSRDAQGRLNTNITHCPKRLRGFLKVEGVDQLCIVDVRNSQPLLLNLLLASHPINHIQDVKEYKADTENGILYQKLMNELGIASEEKDSFKQKFFQNVLYSKYSYVSREGDVFRALYPTVWEFIFSYKNTPDATFVCLEMQRQESNLMVGSISPRLHELGIWHLTIHDAVLCDYRRSPEVSEIVIEEYEKKNLRPSLEIKLLN